MTQNELAEGICTQATLSRFENNGQVPSLKILIKLCHRLDLPISELFPKVGVKTSKIIERMDQAEFALILSEYDEAEKAIRDITFAEIDDKSELLLRYHYLKAFIMIHQNEDELITLHELDQILVHDMTEQTAIYHLLAYTGVGMVYEQSDELDKSEFYFSKVLDRIYDFPTNEIEDVWRVLHIVYQCSCYYANIGDLDISNALANYAIEICSDNHVTYYLARAAVQLARNAITAEEDSDTILELIYDARAYSKINRNKIALEELAEMEKYINNKKIKR